MKGGARSMMRYLGHVAIGWPGVMILGFGGTIIVGAKLGINPDSALSARISAAIGPPLFPLELVIAAGLGYALNRRRGDFAATFVWIPAAVVLAWGISIVVAQPFDGGWAGVWRQYFGSNCQSSECLGEVIVTAPLYTSILYSAAALVPALRLRRRKDKGRV